LWFYWDGASIWLTSLCDAQRWHDIVRDPRVAVVVDVGDSYDELRGVELKGRAVQVGEAPRRGEPVPELEPVERAFARKITGRDSIGHDGRHAWIRITPDKITSWDFRKISPM
jgi:hypothetical protein